MIQVRSNSTPINNCPSRKTLTMRDEEAHFDEKDCETSSKEDVNYLEADEGAQLSCVVQRLLLAHKTEQQPQRHTLFKTKCTVNGKICSVIFDSGSSMNIVSKKLVTALNLITEPHPSPYRVSWIKKGVAQFSYL